MTLNMSLPRALDARPTTGVIRFFLALLALAVLALGLAALMAQVDGNRGIAPVAASSDIVVTGITVDVTGKNAREAREKGWREAQKLAWKKLDAPQISDSQLESLVSSVVIEQERIGPTRYIATLGVIFDRTRAGGYFGGAAQKIRSAPMMVLPVTVSGGTYTMYETRNPWQRAWAEFQPGTSPVHYLRPAGSGGDSLLLTYGQTTRRSRLWWRAILDQFGAADVLVAAAHLRHEWPGGPIHGTFTARHGPDGRVLNTFEMSAKNPAALPDMLAQAVAKFDTLFQQALADGKLAPDPTLEMNGSPDISPALQRLIDLGRALEARDAARAAGEVAEGQPAGPTEPVAETVTGYVVQFASPDARSIDATLGKIRQVPGVRGAATTSIAIGGTSVMTVSFGGSLEQLAAALQAQGYNVRQGSNALAISN